MRRGVRHMVLLMASVLCLVSCHRPRGVVSRNDMTDILSDMIIADYWISIQSPEVRRQSDTTMFYKPIFDKYGCTLDEFLASVDYYLNEPERFAKMVKKAKASIVSHRDKLQSQLDASKEDIPAETSSEPEAADTLGKARQVIPVPEAEQQLNSGGRKRIQRAPKRL